MGSINTAIELQDNFTGIMMNIINTIHMSVAAVEQMQSVMGGAIDISSIEQASEAVQTLNDTLQNMEAPSVISPAVDYENIQPSVGQSQIDVPDNLIVPVETVIAEQSAMDVPNEVIAKQQYLDEPAVPIRWQSDNLNEFNNTSIQRFRQEAQKTNAMLQQLGRTQAAIARRAYNTDIFLPEAFQNLGTMAAGMDNLSGHIRQIGSTSPNMRMDAANAELEQMRVRMNQVVQVQELMNRTVQNMDVRAANGAYQKLLQMIGSTEKNIQSNVDEQSYFNEGIRKGIDGAAELKSKIADAAKAIIKMDTKGLKNWAVNGIAEGVANWIVDCTAAFDTQLYGEIRRISVLASMLDEEYIAQFGVEVSADTTAAVDEINAVQDNMNGVVVPVTAEAEALTAAYGQIVEKAGEIQGQGVFEEEAMVAGAVKLSMYFSEPEAVTAMMDTLSDYAMGMSVLEGKGLAVDVNSMVGYAANLGKITTGTYTTMSQEGFEFTDVQKAIIGGTATEMQIEETLGAEYLDMSTDMQAAAVIASVIGGEWEGLYEIMSNTPEGQIIQMVNTWGNMKEVVGGQLYPYVLLFVDVISQNWGTIQGVVNNITLGLQMMLGVLSWLMEGAINFAQIVMDNWGWISPIIYGIIGALAVYGAYLAITKGLELASNAAKVVMIAAEYAHAAATRTAVSATTAEAAAQMGLNTAFLACPITWIIIAIIALIAIIYAVVAAINKGREETISAMGIICGVFLTAAAFIGNLFVALINNAIDVFVTLWNFLAAFVNFFGNVFDDPVGAIVRLFSDLADTVLGILEAIASAIDTIFGSNFAEVTAGWRDSLGGWVDETFGQGEIIIETLDASSKHLGRFEYGDAWDAGYSIGEGIDESIANFDLSSLFDITDIPSAEEYASALAGGGIGNDINNIAGNTGAMADAMDITEEELKYLRDIAEQETINRFTTAEIHLEQTNHNTIKNGMDLDGIMSDMTDMMNEAIDISTEGVHV